MPNPYDNDRIVELDRFFHVTQAMAVKNLLEENGIRAAIDGEAMAGLFGFMGPNLAGVRVRVFQSDLARARGILAAEEEKAAVAEELADDACDDIDHDTDDEGEAEDEADLAASTAAGLEFLGTEQNIPGPHHESSPNEDDLLKKSAAESTEEDAPSAADAPTENLLRAWRASCLSIVLFPILMNVYSLWVLAREVQRTGRADNWRHYATVLMNMIVLGFYVTIFTVFGPPRFGPSRPSGPVHLEVRTGDGETTTHELAQPKWEERTIP